MWGIGIIQAHMAFCILFGVILIFSHLLHCGTMENIKTFPEVPAFLIEMKHSIYI